MVIDGRERGHRSCDGWRLNFGVRHWWGWGLVVGSDCSAIEDCRFWWSRARSQQKMQNYDMIQQIRKAEVLLSIVK